MDVVEVLIVVCSLIFALVLTILALVAWKFLQKKKERQEEYLAFKHVNKSASPNEPNAAVTPPITWLMTSPQIRGQEYDPANLVLEDLLPPQSLRKLRREKSNLAIKQTRGISKSLNALDMRQELPDAIFSPPLRRPRLDSRLSDSSYNSYTSYSMKSEKQGQISQKMKDDLLNLRKVKSSMKSKKKLGNTWSLNESSNLLPHLSSLENSDSSDFGDIENETLPLIEDSSGHGKTRVSSRRGRNMKPGTHLKVNGILLVTTEYFVDEKKLFVTVHRATNLGGNHKNEKELNPYVRLCLLPDKKHKQESKVKHGTQDPTFEEHFSFANLPSLDLEKHKLSLKVFNACFVKRDELLGESTIFLSSLKHNEKEDFHLDLLAKRSKISTTSIKISLCHKGTYSKLEVIVHCIKDLIKSTSTGNINPYVRLSLYKDDSIETKETRTLSGDRNPTYNEAFDFDVLTNLTTPLSTYSLAVSVMHHSLFRKDYALGHVIFTLDSPQQSAEQHLLEAEGEPHRRITKWHNLIHPDEI